MGYFVEINRFVNIELKLKLHPDKIMLRKLTWGIDFVGYVALPYYNLPRRQTARRMIRQVEGLDSEKLAKSLPSYLGYLQHAASHHLRGRLLSKYRN